MIYKGLLFLVLAVMVVLMVKTADRKKALGYAWYLWWTTLLFIGLIFCKRFFFQPMVPSTLFYHWHLPSAAVFFVCLTLYTFWFNGIRRRYEHSLLVVSRYSFAPLVITGIILILRMKL